MGIIKVKEYHKRLVEGVKKVLESESFAEFMRFSARFHRYSFVNTLLIWLQRPHATRVAGIKTWNSLGRYVKKGERGIVIFAPLIKREKKPVAELLGNAKADVRTVARAEAEVEKELAGLNGIEEQEVMEVERLVGFRAVHVWDIEQTEGKPLPELKTETPVMDGDPEVLFVRILKASTVPVEFRELKGKANGYYMARDRKIILAVGLKTEQKVKTLLHELAHHLIHSGLSDAELAGIDRHTEEVIAEGAAFIASAHFGLDSSGYSFPYVAAWGQDVERVLKTGKTMRMVAVRLIELVEGKVGATPEPDPALEAAEAEVEV